MKPRLLPIIKPIYDLVAKTDIPNVMSRLILLKNNTLVLLNENETCKEKLEQFNNTEHSNMINPNLHFYKSFDTFLFVNPVLQDVGLLYIVEKEEVNMDSIKKLALQNFQKDLLEQEVIFDSSTDDFDLYQPISRTKMLLSETTVTLFNTFLITSSAVYGIWLLCKAYNISISGKGIFVFALTATLLMWAIYGIAILISSLLRSKMSVVAITLAFVLGSFIFYSLSQIFDKLKNYDVLSIFYLYPNPQEILRNGQIFWDKIGILALVLIIGLISSLVIFNKKDI